MLARVITLWDYLPPALAILGLGIAIALLFGAVFSASRSIYIRRWCGVIAVAAVVGSLSWYWHSWREDQFALRNLRERTFQDIQAIESAAFAYFLESDSWPQGANHEVMKLLFEGSPEGDSGLSLEAISVSISGAAIDPWGSELRFTVSESDGFQANSIGPDKTEGTRDDIPRKPES